jgi:high-affinity iron transporter
MLGPALITLREGFEAALIVAVLLAYLRQLDSPRLARSVWKGVLTAGVVSLSAGAVLFVAGHELTGSSEALFEGVAMLAAVGVLSWTALWMQRTARSQGSALRGRVDGALAAGGGALFGLAFLAVVREGLETALFLFASARGASAFQASAGAVVGIAVAVGAGIAVYRGAARLPLRMFFSGTNVLLVCFGAYLMLRGIAEIGEVLKSGAVEIGGPIAAALYALVGLAVLYRVGRRPALPSPVESCDVRGAVPTHCAGPS